MPQRLLRRLFLPSVLVVTTSFVLALVSVSDSTPSLLYFAFAVFHGYLAPAVLLLLAALALLVAVHERRWSWALVLTAVAAFLLALPFLHYLVLGYNRTPLAVQLQQWPFFWYATVGYSLWYGSGFVALFVIWRFLRSQGQHRPVEARHVTA